MKKTIGDFKIRVNNRYAVIEHHGEIMYDEIIVNPSTVGDMETAVKEIKEEFERMSNENVL